MKGSAVPLVFCCGIYQEANRSLELLNNQAYKDRVLNVLDSCEKCKNKKAVLTQTNKFTGKAKDKPNPKGEADSFIKKYENEPFFEFKYSAPKYGSEANMNYRYMDGAVDDWVKDLNNTKQFEFVSKVVNATSKTSNCGV